VNTSEEYATGILDCFKKLYPGIEKFMAKRQKILKRRKQYKPYPESKLCDPFECYSYGETWTTLDGQRIPIVNLRNNHLKNVIEHVKKRKLQGILPYLEAEVERRKKLKLVKKSKAGKLLYGR
jgi:hypothetical protein